MSEQTGPMEQWLLDLGLTDIVDGSWAIDDADKLYAKAREVDAELTTLREQLAQARAALLELYEAELAVKRAAAKYNDAAYREEDGAWLLGKDNPCFEEYAIADGAVNAALAKTQRTLAKQEAQ